MRTLRIRFSMNLLILLLLLVAIPLGTAQALPVDPGNSTLTSGEICSDATVFSCASAPLFELDSPATVTEGTIDLVGTTLSFAFTVPTASFSGADGSITAVDLTDVMYSGSFTVVDQGSGLYSFGSQTSAITGLLSPTGGGAAGSFSDAFVATGGTCSGGAGSLFCGFTFGPVGFDIDLEGTGTTTRYLRQSVNINAVPEPGTALLLGLGLSGLAASRKRRA